MKPKALTLLCAFSLWLAGAAPAAAQANSIEAFDVSQQGGKTVVRVTTREPLGGVPANFAVAKPARIAFDFPNTANALGRSTQDIGQGELRSMNVVQGADRTRLVLNLRRPVVHEATVEGSALVITLSEPAIAQSAPGGQVAHFAEGKADAKHAIRDVDFRRGRAGEGRVVVDLSDTTTGIDIRQQGENIVVDDLPEYLSRPQDGTGPRMLYALPRSEEVSMPQEPESLITLAELEKNYIRKALDVCNRNHTEAARRLGCDAGLVRIIERDGRPIWDVGRYDFLREQEAAPPTVHPIPRAAISPAWTIARIRDDLKGARRSRKWRTRCFWTWYTSWSGRASAARSAPTCSGTWGWRRQRMAQIVPDGCSPETARATGSSPRCTVPALRTSRRRSLVTTDSV
mgnify:CR=1 FL=1